MTLQNYIQEYYRLQYESFCNHVKAVVVALDNILGLNDNQVTPQQRAAVRGTKANDVVDVLLKIPEAERLKVKEVTMDLSEIMADIVAQAFPNAIIVLDCFHIMRRCNDAIEEMRLRCKREAQAKVRKEKSEFKKRQKRNAAHRRRYRKTLTKDTAREKLHGWYKTVNRCTIREVKSARDAIKSREDNVLNYFIARSTNASAESLNSKMKAFRAQLRGVSDLPFFMYRLSTIFG